MNSIKTILIIEDSEESIQLYSEILRTENFLVIEARHGKEALELLESGSLYPDLIIMDLSFPFMTAEEFLQRLRADPDCSKIPVVVISGHMDSRERALRLKTNGFLQKPFDLNVFLSLVKQQIRGV